MIIEKMKKTTEEQTQKLLFYGFVIFIFLLPLPQWFYPTNERAIAMQASILMFAAIYFGILLVIEAVNKRVSFRINGITWKCMAGLTVVGIINEVGS